MKESINKPVIAFIVAHPDDVAHAMGGTAWLLKQKYKLHVFCATRGEYGIQGLPPEDAGRIREKEEAAACALLDADLMFLDQLDAHLCAGEELCRRVSVELKRLRPKAVFTLWPVNRHIDHVAAHFIAVRAIHMAGISSDTELYMAENAIGVITRQYDPDILVDISGVIEEKKQLIRCHASQNPREGNVLDVLERNKIRGWFCDTAYAEAFKTMGPKIVRPGVPPCSVLDSLGSLSA